MKLNPAYQLILLVFITLGVYYPTLFAPFNTLDDLPLVNLLLNQHGFSLERHFSPGGTYDYYRPLVTLTFEIDKHVGGLQEPFMHLFNVLVHVLNVFLVWQITRRVASLLGRTSDWPPFLAALLFALHPVNSEAVNWIMGRTDLLAGSFVFLSLLCLLRFIQSRRHLWGLAGAGFFFLGALCKETALFFLPAACFLLLCRSGDTRREWISWRLRWLLPGYYATAAAGYFFLRRGAFHDDRGLGHSAKLVEAVSEATVATATAGSAGVSSEVFPLLDAVRVAIKTSGFYAVKLLQPLPLNFAINKVSEIYLIPGIFLLMTLVVLVWRRNLHGWFFLASAAIATSALFVLFTGLAWAPVAERYMYIPAGFFVVGAVMAAEPPFMRLFAPRILVISLAMLLTLAGWATAARNMVWQDNLTLYQDTVRKSPDFAPAKNQLAFALYENGRADEARRLLAEIGVQSEDLTVVNSAAILYQQGDYPAAREELLRRLHESGSQYIQIKILETLIGMTSEQVGATDDELLKRKYHEDILGWLEAIQERLPGGFISYRIGRVHLALNNRERARQAFADAAKYLPDDSIYKEPATKLARSLAQ